MESVGTGARMTDGYGANSAGRRHIGEFPSRQDFILLRLILELYHTNVGVKKGRWYRDGANPGLAGPC